MADNPSVEAPCGKIITRPGKEALKLAIQSHINGCSSCRNDLVRFYVNDLIAKGEI